MIEPAMSRMSILPSQSSRMVLTHGGTLDAHHESVTHRTIAERVAALLNFPFGGPYRDDFHVAGCYLVPHQPLSGTACRYSIQSEDDLFGCWVPCAWMATKAIVHPLISARAAAPPDWLSHLALEAAGLTLPGFTAFTAEDARMAGNRLLQMGPVRLKPAGANGGREQAVVRNKDELGKALAAICADGQLTDILCVEQNLEDVRTYSVGQVRLPGRKISYCGRQSLTVNHDGASAYGGSSLFVVRGDFDALLSCALPVENLEAVKKAIAFDELVSRHVPGLIASRRNYDVASGLDVQGSRQIGVLEQSWRIGGATPAEIAAFEAFAREPRLQAVRAFSVETYAYPDFLPEGATVYYQGNDPLVGPLTKYAWVQESR